MSSSPPSPPFLTRFWSTLLIVLTVVGVPAGTVAFLHSSVAEHPLLSLGIVLLYEVAVFVLGFVGKVWQRLETSWAERTATRFDHWVQGTLSRYRRQYYHYLGYQHRDFDVKGLSTLGPHALELDQVFVELSVDSITPQQATTNPIQTPQVLLRGNHSVWDYLTSASLRKHHFVIIGPPGSGKTTLLKHITLRLVVQWKLHYRLHYMRLPRKVPILLFLRDHAQSINEQADFSLVDAVHEHLKKWEQPSPPEGWVKRQLTKGRCLVLLDGLDEVANPEARQAVVKWVERQMVAYCQNRFNRFLITSRPFGYRSNPLNGATVLEVQPFTTEQVERFIHKWYLANEIMSKQKDDPGVRMRARADARMLLRRLSNTPVLLDLTVNPLLLTMIATVHRYGGELPGNRVALYSEICEVFLGKRQIARGQVLELRPEQMQLVLAPLAYYMMVKGIRDIALDEMRTVIKKPLVRVSRQMAPEQFVQLVENVSGLLLERENGVYSFAHLTFQEYLAATYIREKQLGQTLIAQVGATWWRETIRLYCALADATPIIVACLADERPSVGALELAIDCDKEAREVQPEVSAKLETLLKQGAEDPDPEWQHVIAGALLSRRLRQMIHLKDETYVDTSLITCAEYQMFLDAQQGRGRYLQPDHWTSYHFPTGQSNAPVLGVRPSDASTFCEWLTEGDLGTWRYRLPTSDELEKVQENASEADRLAAGTGYWIDGGKGFDWARGHMLPPDSIAQEQLGQFQERDRVFNYPSKVDPLKYRELNENIGYARDLANARMLHEELTRTLIDARNRTRTREHTLRSELNQVHQGVLTLQTQLEDVRKHKNDLQAQLESVRQHQFSSRTGFNRIRQVAIQGQLSHVGEQENAISAQLKGVHKHKNDLQAQLSRERRRFFSSQTRQRAIQTQLTDIGQQENDLQAQFQSVHRHKNDLQAQLDHEDHRESTIQAQQYSEGTIRTQLDHEDHRESTIQTQLDHERHRESTIQAQFNRFLAHARALYSICDRFLPSIATYNSSDAFFSALTRNRVLKLDSIVDKINGSTFEDALAHFNNLVSTYTRDFVSALTHYSTSTSTDGNGYDDTVKSDDITRALNLAINLERTPFNVNVEYLHHTLRYYLDYLSQWRPLGKGKSLLRLSIRYFARELADHLSYWSWKELFLPTEQSSHPFIKKKESKDGIDQYIIDAYVDAYMAFVILEARVEGRFPACEGILIVREHRGENLK